jgi:hypothetical protein
MSVPARRHRFDSVVRRQAILPAARWHRRSAVQRQGGVKQRLPEQRHDATVRRARGSFRLRGDCIPPRFKEPGAWRVRSGHRAQASALEDLGTWPGQLRRQRRRYTRSRLPASPTLLRRQSSGRAHSPLETDKRPAASTRPTRTRSRRTAFANGGPPLSGSDRPLDMPQRPPDRTET